MATAPEPSIGTASMLGVRAVLAYTRRARLDADALARDARLDPARLDDPDARIPLSVDHRVWELAAQRSPDPAFALHFAAQVELGTFEALDYAIWCSATVDDALQRLVRFYRLLGDDLALSVVRSRDAVHLIRETLTEVAPRAEAYLAVLVARARSLIAAPPDVREVRFRHARPDDLRPYRAFFRCPVKFAAKTTELIIEARALQLPVATARPALAAILDRYMRDLLAQLPVPDVFARRVHDAIARSLHGGRPSVAITARQLNVSRRTLQRYLQQVGLSHRDLVDEVRRGLAERMLATPRLSIAEIAYLLGFETPSGFHKAYKRWHGEAPSSRGTRR